MSTRDRVFLLSPASTAGRRAAILLNPSAEFELARRLRAQGAPIGEVFSFLSGLYFRGKLAYARAFAAPPAGAPGVLVITSDRGLVSPDVVISLDDLHALADVPIDVSEPRYRAPLERDLAAIAALRCDVVLLGSIASGKYVDVLVPIFGDRLLFPTAFVGRGDMSRGGLMLRSVENGHELEYTPVAMAVRRGERPPRLEPVVAARRPRP